MTGRIVACSVLVVTCVVVLCQLAAADAVTADAVKGKCVLTVMAGEGDVYVFHLWLQRGSFRSWEAPEGWIWSQPAANELLFATESDPIPVGGTRTFVVKASGPGRNTVWETLAADGTVLDWGRVNLK